MLWTRNSGSNIWFKTHHVFFCLQRDTLAPSGSRLLTRKVFWIRNLSKLLPGRAEGAASIDSKQFYNFLLRLALSSPIGLWILKLETFQNHLLDLLNAPFLIDFDLPSPLSILSEHFFSRLGLGSFWYKVWVFNLFQFFLCLKLIAHHFSSSDGNSKFLFSISQFF